jgi:hypothetical protein
MQSFPAASATYPVHIREIEQEQAAFRAWQRRQSFKRSLHRLLSFWPLAGGAMLGLIAPRLSLHLGHSMPWMLWILFPFTLLAERSGLPDGLHLAGTLPLLMLCAQFPVDGLIARVAVRRHVTLSGIAWQVFSIHFLGAMQLLMVSGAVSQALRL